MSRSLLHSDYVSGSNYGMKNRIINGGMQVAQRGAVASSNGTAVYGGVDRMLVHPYAFTTASGNITQGSNGNFITGSCTQWAATTTGSGSVALHHRIEALNSISLNNKTITVQIKAYQETASTLTPTFILYKANTTDTFGAVTQIGSTVTLASAASGAYTTYTASFALGATDASTGLQITFTWNGIGAITAKNFLYGDFQLEVGAIATPFEHRPYGTELALCQRYFYLYCSTAIDFQEPLIRSSTTIGIFNIRTPVTMRNTPLLYSTGSNPFFRGIFYDTAFGIIQSNITAISITSVPTFDRIDIVCTHGSVAGTYVYSSIDNAGITGVVGLSAEL